MDRKFLIKLLELLDETYPESYSVERLTKKLNLAKDGIFSKSIRYLKLRDKIIATDVLHPKDLISITPEGIDFFDNLKSLEFKEILAQQQKKIFQKQTFFAELVALASIIIGVSAVVELFQLQLDQVIDSTLKIIFQVITFTILLTALTFLIIETIIYTSKKYKFKKLKNEKKY